MAGCDGWITIKILELLFATFCMIYKRVTDDEANKLFYFLQKYSREWPLLNNITWEENGAIFTDITYGGYIIIIIGLIIGQCSGELQRCRKLENFFLIVGALLFITAGSLELAALESVEERLVDNAAILGVFSLITGFLFIIDLLLAGKRRKKEKIKVIQKSTQSKLTQTEEKKSAEAHVTSDMNGNIQNGGPYFITQTQDGHRIPRNAVKILPSSPVLDSTNDLNKGTVYTMELPAIDGNDLKTHEGRIRSTESFLRSEKGLYPAIRKSSEQDRSNNNFFVPAGYVMIPADHFQAKSITKSDSGIGETPTPPGYAKVIPGSKTKPGYVIIPVDHTEPRKDGSRKLQSPTVTTTVKGPQEFYYVSGSGATSLPPDLRGSAYIVNSSDLSDYEEPKHQDRHKYESRLEKSEKPVSRHSETYVKDEKYFINSEDSSDEQKLGYPSEVLYRPDSRRSMRSLQGSKEWRYTKGKINEGYKEEDSNDKSPFYKRASPYTSSRASSPEKPKSILRSDHGSSSKSESGLYFPKTSGYDSLDGQKIAEHLHNLKRITTSDLDLDRNLEKENKFLKERLRQEKEEKEKLKYDLEDRKKLDQQMKESEEEKNRRISEREEQYFGIKDLKQSHKESVIEESPRLRHLDKYYHKNIEKGKGAKEINERLKEKYLEHENKSAKEVRDLIDERFYFLDEEEKRKKRKEKASLRGEETSPSDMKSASHLTEFPKTGKPLKSQKSDSDETPYSQSTDEEIRLRVETPGSASYKSEALFWLGNDREEQNKSPVPTSPASPGYVLYTAQNWPESPSPQDRLNFSAKEAQQLTIGTPPKTPLPQRVKPDIQAVEEKKISQRARLLDFEEVPDDDDKSLGRRKGLLVRKVDFPKEPPLEIKKPATIAGSTSSWKKWLQPKPKLQHTRSVPD